jgi:ABC-type nitrate/sulfonate/bicarbonate transport system substrate-binding protein
LEENAVESHNEAVNDFFKKMKKVCNEATAAGENPENHETILQHEMGQWTSI